jgi:nitrogen fixation NifU-like protein
MSMTIKNENGHIRESFKEEIGMDEFYSEKALEHFMSPKNMRVIETADAEGDYGDPECGDYMILYLKVDNEIISDIGVMVYGCPASIATASMASELAKGSSIEDALHISEQNIIDALGGLPEHKKHCSLLAVSALRNAIDNYKKKK